MTLIKNYINAFLKKDLKALEGLFTDDMSLQDPGVGLVKDKANVLKVYAQMFEGNTFSLKTGREFKEGNTFVLEFSLKIVNVKTGTIIVDGIDLIEVSGDKIKSIRAYLDTSETVQKRTF